jgi:hypothetical protein
LLKNSRTGRGATRSQRRHFFLFDHMLLYCKASPCKTKGEKLLLKGRLPTDGLIIQDGTGGGRSNAERNSRSFRVVNHEKRKMYVLEANSEEEKQAWMVKFKEERDVVRSNIAAGIDRCSVERHSSALSPKGGRRLSKQSKSKSIKAKARRIPSIEEATEVASTLEGRVSSFNPIDVQLSISADALSWAFKSMELEVHSRDAVVQMALDSFNLSEHRAADLALMQRTPDGDVELPSDPIPYFAMNKEGGPPYTLYLRHKKLTEIKPHIPPPAVPSAAQGPDEPDLEAVRGTAVRAQSYDGADC